MRIPLHAVTREARLGRPPHHPPELGQRPGQVSRQTVRQQAHRLPALRASETQYPHSLRVLGA